MHPDVRSLIAVQQEDLALYALEGRLGALAPRIAALEKERGVVTNALDRARKGIEAEESRLREARGRVETHRGLLDRSQRQFESVTTPREAAAADVQLEQSRRMVDESSRDADQVQGRINEMRHQVAELEQQLADVESRQADARTSIETDREAVEEQLRAARATREQVARAVPKAVLSRYEKVRSRRRSETVFPLRGQSCSACDTAIPTQRRAEMAATGALEMCEGCGALLYAPE